MVTDALVMEAITEQYGAAEAAVLAFEAGADLILMPADADAAIDGLCTAFGDGRLSSARLEQSLHRRRIALQSIPAPDLHTAAPAEGITAEERQLEVQLVARSLDIPADITVRPASGVNPVSYTHLRAHET